MVEDSSVNLTDAEAELYDRQIRLWGIESQQRIRCTRVLVIGLDGIGVEIVKNLALSGVNSITMLDDQVASIGDSTNQFFIPVDKIGQNRAEASFQRAQNLNPLVSIIVDKEPISEKSDSFLKNFEVIVSCSQDLSSNIRIDNFSRENAIAFIATGVYGSYGYMFSDFSEHSYSVEYTSGKKGAEPKTKIEKAVFPSMESVMNIDLNKPEIIKKFLKLPPAFFLLKVLYKFRSDFKRNPTESEEDQIALTIFRDSILDGLEYPKESFDGSILKCVSVGQLSPVCAIVGAIVSQEVIKVASKKDRPHHNFFFFDPLTLSGFVQSIAPL